jgi:hypothetical protein
VGWVAMAQVLWIQGTEYRIDEGYINPESYVMILCKEFI